MFPLFHCLRIFGLDFRRSFHAARGIGRYLKNLREFKARMGDDFRWGGSFPSWTHGKHRAGTWVPIFIRICWSPTGSIGTNR